MYEQKKTTFLILVFEHWLCVASYGRLSRTFSKHYQRKIRKLAPREGGARSLRLKADCSVMIEQSVQRSSITFRYRFCKFCNR